MRQKEIDHSSHQKKSLQCSTRAYSLPKGFFRNIKINIFKHFFIQYFWDQKIQN